jgi:hypothetical protein
VHRLPLMETISGDRWIRNLSTYSRREELLSATPGPSQRRTDRAGEFRPDRVARADDARVPRTSGPRGTPVQGGVHREETAPVWEIFGRACDVASPKRDVVVRATRVAGAEPGTVRGAAPSQVIHG